MREKYEKEKHNWFPRDDTQEYTIYDNRTPGLFKVEFSGDGMVCLAPKMFCCLNEQ